MHVRPLSIEGAWEFTPQLRGDDRGLFLEAYKGNVLAETVGHPLTVKQVNTSVSAAGVLRGIHFAEVGPSQAKYVTCSYGAVLDVIVDIRTGSPTFGQWDAVVLDDVDRRAVYVSEGLGHAFLSLADGSAVTYLCSEPYSPSREHEVHPLDPQIGIAWPTTGRDGTALEYSLSPKDEAAPVLAQAQADGLLPSYDAALAFRAGLAQRHEG
jgi:dTDP-4-dehydrorhamnose 3,5-epimerase